MRISTNDKNTLDRNPGDGTMNGKSVTAFLLSPHCRIYRHILLQVAVLLITINVFWYEPLQVVSLLKRFGGCLVYFLSMNAVIYTNLYVLVPSFLLKNRLGGYVLAAIVTNLVVILFLSVTQGMLFEVILPVRNPDGFATFINTFSGILTMGFVTAGSAAISLFTHWLRHNLRIDQLESTTLQSELKFLKSQINPHFLFNMLNNANVLIKRNPEEASKVLSNWKICCGIRLMTVRAKGLLSLGYPFSERLSESGKDTPGSFSVYNGAGRGHWLHLDSAVIVYPVCGERGEA